MKKSIAQLIDELCVTNMKIWALVERVEAKKNTVEEGQKMNKLVAYRTKLMAAINEFYTLTDEEMTKVYGSDLKK
jgi:hypothetical protein